jgi:hypothetical protein
MPASLLDDANDLCYGLCSIGKLATVGLGRPAALAVEPVGFLCIGAHGITRTIDLLLAKGAQSILSHFGCIPQFLRHDTKLGSLGAYPVAFGVEAVCEVPGVGVLELLLPVPADDADIKLTVQDAGTDDAVAPDGGIVPAFSREAWDALAVQVGSDVARPFAGDTVAEDAPHDFGLSSMISRSPGTGSPCASSR